MTKYKKSMIVKTNAICINDDMEYLGIKNGDNYIAFLEVRYNPMPKDKCCNKKCNKHA